MSEFVNRYLFRPYWRLTRAMTLGVRGVVRDGDGRVLLVKHSYLPGWHLPGGGVERGETLMFALRRELQEEGGVEVAGAPRLHGVFASRSFAGDHVAVFVVEDWRAVAHSHGHEITGCDFFDLAQLPQDTTEGTRARLSEIFAGAPVSEFWSREE
ncbi:MAG: NUDIX domain-containing protein [Rhodobiaceae bacterium]|nr:NUDIX domain-containing protein [Rhodobiaceae bacterium]MCC0015339.1 NUDIX domain-containing protein [Rhodobiaceae bacterium]MCC0053422.1 NUDIX domain-containing protein [Rhodobiaceae bacterium]